MSENDDWSTQASRLAGITRCAVAPACHSMHASQ